MSTLQSMVLKDEKSQVITRFADVVSILYDLSMDSTLVSKGNLTAVEHRKELLEAQDAMLKRANEAKGLLDQFVICDIASNTDEFKNIAANLKTVNDEITAELKELEKLVRTMQNINKFLKLVDKGLEIAAGLAKTL